MIRPQKRKSVEKIRTSSKSVKEKRNKINTDDHLSPNVSQSKRRKQSISIMHSKSINKGNRSRHNFSKSKGMLSLNAEYLTPSKENDDIYHLVHPKFNKKLTKTKEI